MSMPMPPPPAGIAGFSSGISATSALVVRIMRLDLVATLIFWGICALIYAAIRDHVV